MNKSITKFWDKIVVVLLTATGMFTGCKPDCDKRITLYGIEATEYQVKGKVTNKANSKPIPNIQITRQVNENSGDTLYTDSKGNYIYKFYNYSINSENPLCLKFEDIDGEANGGNFATKEIDVKFTKSNRRCDGYGENYTKTENIKLEKK